MGGGTFVWQGLIRGVNGGFAVFEVALGWGCPGWLALSGLWEGVACGLCPKSKARRARLTFEDYPADKLRRHFTCGFDFKHSL